MFAFLSILFIASLLMLGLIDWRSGFLPDALTFPLLLTGLACNAAGIVVPWSSAVLGTLSGFCLLWLLGKCCEYMKGQHTIGLGDAKLLAALAAWLGWQSLPYLLLLSAGITLLYGGVTMLLNRRMFNAIPYGPGLALAGSIYWFFVIM